MIVNKSMFPLQTGFGVISKMQDKFAQLQMQLGTGVKAQTLADMGRDLPVSLSVRSRLSTIAGYNANIEQVNLRLSFYDDALTRMDKIEGEVRNSAVQGQYGTNNINMATIPSLSKARLDEVVTLLNSDIAGRYLFGGNVTDKAPLPDSTTLLQGSPGRAGFETVLTERKATDAGSDMFGRLEPGLSGSAVTLADQDHPFGYKLSSLTTNSIGVTLLPPVPGGSPANLSVTLSDMPEPIAAGQSVTIGLRLPDGTQTQIKLTATTSAESAPGMFRIGTTPGETAANFKDTLEESLRAATKAELAAASTFAATQNFFNAAGDPVLRVDTGIPYDPHNATGLRIADGTDTVMWYRGQTSAADENPRQSVSAAVEDSGRVNYGMQANESGYLRLMRSLAAMSVESFPEILNPPGPDATPAAIAEYEKNLDGAKLRFDAMARRQQLQLSEGHNSERGSIEMITMELGVARAALGSAEDRHTNYKAQLENLLSDVETVNKEDVAMEILALQTRLTASYQVTAMVSQLSLVNFL